MGINSVNFSLFGVKLRDTAISSFGELVTGERAEGRERGRGGWRRSGPPGNLEAILIVGT